jgi:hypothetical protein
MSRHEVTPLPDAGQVEVFVGWDPPLNTFFAQVFDLDIDEDDPSAELLWIGASFGEIHDLRRVRNALQPWAELPADVESALYAEAHA